MKDQEFLAEARLLAAASRPMRNGAASRAYFALFRALVARLELQGHSPATVSRSQGAGPPRWTHASVRLNCGLAGLGPAERKLVAQSWGLRVKADYLPDAVTPEELEGILESVPRLLEAIGR